MKALNYTGIDFEGHMYDALCDAKNTAELFDLNHDGELDCVERTMDFIAFNELMEETERAEEEDEW